MLCPPMLKTPKTIVKLTTTVLTVFTLFGLFFIFGSIDKAAAATYESTFDSRLLDGYHPSVEYGSINWTADTSATTSLTIQVRGGPDQTQDGDWTSYATVTNGQDLGADFDGLRYLQY